MLRSIWSRGNPLQTDRYVLQLLKRLSALAPAGFAIGLHVRYSTPTFMFQSYPQPWVDTYSREGLMMVDPTVAWGMRQSGSVSWRDLEASDGHGVFDRAREFGIIHGRTWAIHSGDAVTIGSLAKSVRDFTAAEVATATHEIEALHDATQDIDEIDAWTAARIRSMAVTLTQRPRRAA